MRSPFQLSLIQHHSVASPYTGPLAALSTKRHTMAGIIGSPKHTTQYTQRCRLKVAGFAEWKNTRYTLKAMANDHHGSDCMNHSSKKACVRHSALLLPWAMPDIPIRLAVLAPMLAMEANRINVLGTVRRRLKRANVMMMSRTPIMERVAPARSIPTTTLAWCPESCIVARSSFMSFL